MIYYGSIWCNLTCLIRRQQEYLMREVFHFPLCLIFTRISALGLYGANESFRHDIGGGWHTLSGGWNSLNLPRHLAG